MSGDGWCEEEEDGCGQSPGKVEGLEMDEGVGEASEEGAVRSIWK